MKTIALFINDLRAGGAERNFSFLANGLQAAGYHVLCACYGFAGSAGFYKLSAGIERVCLRYHYSRLAALTDRAERDDYIRTQRREVEAVLQAARPQAAVAFLPNMCILVGDACAALGIRSILCGRNDPEQELKSERARRKLAAAYERSAGCVFQTREICEYFGGAVMRHSRVIPNPILLPFAAEDVPRRREAVVSVAKYTPQKNLPLLVDAFSRLHRTHPALKLEIYGKDYGEKGRLQAHVRSLGLEDRVSLFDETEDVHARIQDAAVFVLPSDYEGMPNALAEAVAMGIPSVACDCRFGGPGDILGHGRRGILVPVGDVHALENAIERLLTDPALCTRYGAEGRRLAEERSPARVMQAWIAYIEEVMTNDAVSGA